MEVLERMPFKGRKAVFDRLEQMASKANMTVAERQQYEEEWKNWNDYYNTLDYAKKEGGGSRIRRRPTDWYGKRYGGRNGERNHSYRPESETSRHIQGNHRTNDRTFNRRN